MRDRLKRESGLRMTAQREEVLSILRGREDHPSAAEVFVRVRERIPTISLATVYNCLEALSVHGMINAVHTAAGGPTRYCANLGEHAHFHCSRCGGVFDVPAPEDRMAVIDLLSLPEGTTLEKVELSLEGVCASCGPSADRNSRIN